MLQYLLNPHRRPLNSKSAFVLAETRNLFIHIVVSRTSCETVVMCTSNGYTILYDIAVGGAIVSRCEQGG